jgi:hypothetical protein
MIKYLILLIIVLVEIIQAIIFTLFEFLWDFNCTTKHFEDALKTYKDIIEG